MAGLRYPIGIQTFRKIIDGGYAYVDKTGFIPQLIKDSQYLFLSRPRRFGKSLTLSMLRSFFEGERRLFRGLAVDSMDVEWKRRPVLHIDFNAENYRDPNGLNYRLDTTLSRYEETYAIASPRSSYSDRFCDVILAAERATGEKVVILVDEYDKPLLQTEDKPELFERNQAMLKGFFGVLKTMDDHIEFGMLTGVARFNKVSIFSDLNNLRDISMEHKFADLCGWTQVELEEVFHDGIMELGDTLGLDYAQTLERMKYMYDGYLFAPGGSRLYNPYSVLTALASLELGYYWFETGTPTFLVRRILRLDMLLPSLNRAWASRRELASVGMNDRNPIPILFQTGYLTIGKETGGEYELRFPNKEVEIGFADSLTRLYMPEITDLNGDFGLRRFRLDLLDGNPEQFMKRLETLLKGVPYEQHNEKLYQNVVYLLFTLLGASARMEEHTSRGRSDLVVEMREAVYVFEFKFERSAEKGMDQIHDRDYAGKYAMDSRRVWLIAANFTKEAHGLASCLIEEYYHSEHARPMRDV